MIATEKLLDRNESDDLPLDRLVYIRKSISVYSVTLFFPNYLSLIFSLIASIEYLISSRSSFVKWLLQNVSIAQ